MTPPLSSTCTIPGDPEDLFSPDGYDAVESENSPFSKGRGMFSGTGALFDELAEEEEEIGKSPRINSLEASTSSTQCESGNGRQCCSVKLNAESPNLHFA